MGGGRGVGGEGKWTTLVDVNDVGVDACSRPPPDVMITMI